MNIRGARWWVVALSAVALTFQLAGASARAELLVNGNFEDQPSFNPSDARWLALTGDQIPGWTIADGHYATVHRTGAEVTIAGEFSINTDGEGTNGNNIHMHQDFGTTLGDTLELSFQWAGWYENNNDDVQLSISLMDLSTENLLFSGLYTSDGLLQAHTVSHEFTGTGNTIRLLVQEVTGGSRGNNNLFLVDNFSVVVTQAVVPEPTGLVLLGLGALGAVGLSAKLRRARRAADA